MLFPFLFLIIYVYNILSLYKQYLVLFTFVCSFTGLELDLYTGIPVGNKAMFS